LNLCLQSVQRAIQQVDAEIIIVDNHSSDSSCEMVKANFSEVILVENKTNYGFSKANNQGVSLAQGEYVLILNPDTVLAEDTLEKIILFADKIKNLGALGVKLIDGTGKYLSESKRNIPTPKRALYKLLSNSHYKLSYYANQINENEIAEVPVLVGAFMLLKRETYTKVGGFDEQFFMYGEDIDLCYQLLELGYKNYYYGATQVIHYKGESTKKDIKYLKYFYGAMKLFYRKHFKVNKLYDYLMSFGIRLWFWVKYFSLLFSREKVEIIQKVLYVGTDENIFSKLNLIYPSSEIFIFPVCTTRVVSRFDDLEHLNRLIDEHKIQEVIFDNESISYSRLIFFMSQLNRKGLIFKIKPSNADYIIGSNCSIGKGMIEKL
jgi:GT2 family glycosyltransferase